MLLARVVGNVVSTAKNESLTGKKLLILQPIDSRHQDRGAKLIALDSVGAGAGETVYYCRGREASFPWYPDEMPVDATIVGIVDRVNIAQLQQPEVRRHDAADRKTSGRRMALKGSHSSPSGS